MQNNQFSAEKRKKKEESKSEMALHLNIQPLDLKDLVVENIAGDNISTVNGKCKCNQILIVDDGPYNIITCSALLNKKFNLSSDEATNGKEAIEKIKESTFRRCCGFYKLVLMDCNMPIMDGFEAMRMIQKMKDGKFLPEEMCVVALTAYASDDVKKECLKSGAFRYLTKPFKYNELTDILHKLKLI